MTIENEKVVAGLSCREVLARLSDYLDGELAAAERARVEEHLRGCDGCARFGGELRATVRALREHLGVVPEVPSAVQHRLRASIDEDAT
jgi:anti-sigma factor RsiW